MADLYDDTKVFATYTQLARLLAAEDIIVRWNVPNLDSVAQMDAVRRVLDIAPIKRGEENRILGKIIHEVAHFLETENYSKKIGGLRTIDEEKFEEYRALVRSEYLWNIIEDGWVERRAVARWPGGLKHLRVLYDADKEEIHYTGNVVIDTLSVLHLNVLGSKWNERFEYEHDLSPKLLALLDEARYGGQTTLDRVRLSNSILRELEELPGWNELNDETSPPEEEEWNESMRQRSDVDEAGAVKLTGDRDKAPLLMNELKDGRKIKEDEDVSIETFISQNAARILGTNRYYMERVVDFATAGDTLYIATPDEVKYVSDITDLYDKQVKSCLTGWSFAKFVHHIQSTDEGKHIYRTFSDKMDKSRGIAQMLFQQFITRANAQNLGIRKYRRSGVLDVNRAPFYRVYDDVFQKRSISPKQINHSYVVMIDWSKSMAPSAMELYHRVCELYWFAKLSNVEVDMWLYTTNDSMISPSHIGKVKDHLRENILLTGSSFTRVLNSKKDSSEEIMFRLFMLFANAVMHKDVPSSKSILRSAMTWFGDIFDIDFLSLVYTSMVGTNIFEATTFAVDRARELKTDKRSVILLTDGDDNPAFTALIKDGERQFKTEMDKVSSVMYKGIDLVDLARRAQEDQDSLEDKYGVNSPFKNLRVGATYLVAEDARNDGISIVGITWGSIISRPLELITANNTSWLPVTDKAITSRSIMGYSPDANAFVNKITEALLASGT